MSSAETGSPPPADHPIYSYLEFKERLSSFDSVVTGNYGWDNTRDDRLIDVVANSALAAVLKRLVSTPWTDSMQLSEPEIFDCKISVFGEDAGTIGNPNIDVIMAKTKPSSFGKGDQTVYDPSYRNGREIAASDLKLSNESSIIKAVELDVMDYFYPSESYGGKRRKTTIELYKLAVYERGGHFNWHKDSTHGDDHHATLLVALKTEWKGGELKLRHNGINNSPNMHPSPDGAVSAVAFFTDVEHMVEPVDEGVRLVLQFDIRFEKKPDEESGDNDPGSKDQDGDNGEVINNLLQSARLMLDDEYMLPRAPIVSFSGNQTQLEEMVEVIKSYHQKMKVYEVGIPLQHLYRQASIQPKYLKGIDALLYETLKSKFDVSLHPILLYHRLDDDKFQDYVLKFEAWDKAEDNSEESDAGQKPPPKKKRKKLSLKRVFHLTDPVGPVELVNSKEYIEYTGNEAQAGEDKYFAGGMFIRPAH